MSHVFLQEQSDAEVQFKREELRKKTQQLQHQTKVTQRVEHDKEIMVRDAACA